MSNGLFGAIISPRQDPEVEEARMALRQLRASLAEFQNARVYSQRALLGAAPCKYTPAELKGRLDFYRDPVLERKLKSDLHELMRQIYQRDPTAEEMQMGIPDPEGLGLVPALFGVAAIVAGLAWTASSVANVMTASERRANATAAQQEGIGSTATKVAKAALVVGGLGGAAFGGYKLWKWAKNRPAPAKEPEAPEEESEPEDEDEDEDEDEEE